MHSSDISLARSFAASRFSTDSVQCVWNSLTVYIEFQLAVESNNLSQCHERKSVSGSSGLLVCKLVRADASWPWYISWYYQGKKPFHRFWNLWRQVNALKNFRDECCVLFETAVWSNAPSMCVAKLFIAIYALLPCEKASRIGLQSRGTFESR